MAGTFRRPVIEGYLEYQRSVVIARAGRQLVVSRLEPVGFDGGWLRVRWDKASLDFTGYGGWGLGQSAAVSAASPALNPLDEWRPTNRQLVAGAEAALRLSDVDIRAEYRREIDPQAHYFVSERQRSRLARTCGMRGGGNDSTSQKERGERRFHITYGHRGFGVGRSAALRPYFSLWTLWGAFSRFVQMR